jgi:hypothetical protein
MRLTRKWLAIGMLGGAGIAVGVAFSMGVFSSTRPQPGTRVPHFRTVDRDTFRTSLAKMSGGAESEATDGPAQEAYDNLAYPAVSIAAAQQQTAANAADAIGRLAGGKRTNWQEVGPSGVPASALVASESTGASTGTIYSGRTTAIAISPDCHANDCKILIGAAGGGVWEADNAGKRCRCLGLAYNVSLAHAQTHQPKGCRAGTDGAKRVPRRYDDPTI